MKNMKDNAKFVRWNAAVYDEILFAVLLLPFAEADVRAYVSRVISARLSRDLRNRRNR